jgi:hypothetical protein
MYHRKRRARRSVAGGPGTNARSPMSQVCDFCDAPDPAFAYPVTEITLSRGAEEVVIPAAWWNSCLDCHHLVENRNWTALTEHAGYPPGFAATPVAAFRRHRSGVAVALPTGDGAGRTAVHAGRAEHSTQE